MKLRSKLSLGIGILFTLILIQGIQSIRYVRHLSVSSKEILSDNYNSVHYVRCSAPWSASLRIRPPAGR